MSWLDILGFGRRRPDFPGSHPADWESVNGLTDSDFAVGPHRLIHAEPLTDDTREEAIQRAGDAMVAAHVRGDMDRATHLLDIREALIARRSPEQEIDEDVDYFQTEGERARRMAQARGLDCDGR